MGKLSGKIAAVTGAASGIGLACATAMINEGAKVVLIDRDSAAVTALAEKLGGQAIPLICDLLDEQQCATLDKTILAFVPHIDIFHANAGAYIGGDLVDTTPAAIDRMLDLNINVVIKNVHLLARHMVTRETGDIIITSSVAGHSAVPWEPVYSASKWAMTCFVQTMRRQLLKNGVRVGSVSPGPVVTALLADWPEENLRKAKESGALIDASEVADAVLYMLTRPRNVTIRDIVVLPSSFDI